MSGVTDRWRPTLASLSRPDVQTDLLQVAKASIATVVAWLLAARVLGLEQGFLAAWAALLTIHATVYRTFWRGAQSVVATLLGIVLSYAATSLMGYGAASLGVAVLVGLLLARTPLIKAEGVAVATTALFVITSGYQRDEVLLVDRFLDTLIGVAVGVVVNVVLLPPLDDRIAERALDRATVDLGRLLEEMADGLGEDLEPETPKQWIEQTRGVDARLDAAQEQLSFTQESQWANLRRHRSWRTADVDRETELLVRLEEGVAQARAIARVVDESVVQSTTWDEEFRERWTDLLRRVGRRVADPEGEVEDLVPELDRLVHDLSHEELPSRHWPVYGSLITSLRHITTVVDDVASHRDALRPAAE
ncbi:aromatic acid exporter family protein [Nocardioides sp. GCM10027113]|uniref:FUSC family protein n=1 Tax=unclassified Nocardioides TaxID=2615069 RepID=UPI00361C225B